MTGNILFGIFFFTFVTKCQQYEVVPSINDTRVKLDNDDGKGSLVFVFDTTGSMFNDLRQLREGAEMILKTALEDSNVIADFVFVPFHDPAVGPATVTRDKQVFKSALNIVRVYGGGDCPEKSLTGIQMALNVSRPRSFIYVFTDATASDHKLVGSVLDAIQKMQSQVVFVLTGHCNDLHKPSYKVYQQIAAASSGQVFNLNKTSVYKVLEFVRTSIKGRTVNLGSAFNPAGYNYTQKIPVDKSVGEVTVSVSGLKPQIKVVNPSGEELTGPPQLITTLDLSEIMIVKVLEPEPGNWSIIVGSEEEHSVKVVGLSNLTFQHGFSVKPPNSLEETSYRPLQDAYNHMMISLSETNTSLQLERVQLLGLDGKAIFEVPLKGTDKKRTYVADAFVPPNDFFNIAIIGHDEFGQEVRRVGPTAVQVKRPDVPELSVPQRIMARTHERVRLSCHSHSTVPQAVAWDLGSLRLMKPETALESKTVEYVIDDMSEGNVGVYHCVAKNVAGQSRASTVVDLIVDPPRVNISAVNTTISEHGDLIISCTIFSETLIQRTQIVFNGTFRNYAVDVRLEPTFDGYYAFNKTIRNVTERNSGLYTCVAANRAGYANNSIQITVQLEPIAQILGPHTITKSEHSDAQFVCHVENAFQVQWLHDNKTVGSNDVNGSYNAVLNVRNVTEDGIWTCNAIRDSYNAYDTIKLIVLIKPHVVIEGLKNITVLNGTNHELVCTIVAKPKPRILWHMETERFLPNVITNPEPNVYKSVLTLNSQKEPVNGTYFCFGENSEGIDHDSVTINVRRKMALIQGFTDISTGLYSQIDLTCNIDSYPPPNIMWYHNDTRINTDDNIDVSKNNTVVHIHKVDFDDLGLYFCKADNGFENMTVSGNLSVHGLEKPVILKKYNKMVTQKGKIAEISCRIQKGKPKPSITWYYKYNSTEYSSLPGGVTIKGENILIVNTKKNHAGVYRCTAENVLGDDFNDVELIVQYPPEFDLSQESHLEGPIEVKAGVETKLSCNVSGIPLPIVTWTKDEFPVTYSSRVYLSNDSVLVIAYATKFDSGVFRCNASSALGFVTKDFNITVYMPPQIQVPEDRELSVNEGELVALRCNVTGHPPPDLSWIKDGRLVESPRLYVDEYGLRFVANVTDFGEYTCLASNQYGNASLNYTVYVWVPPHIEPPVEVVEDVLLGTNVHLECDAVGFPIPIIMWEYREEILSENKTDLSFDNFGNLYVNNISSKYEGLFICVAENIAGVARKNFFVNVNEKPKILADNYTDPYLASDLDTSLTIACRATGRPRPYIAWIKDGYYLDKDSRYDIERDGTLTIRSPSEELSGVYTCVAANGAGNDTRDVRVQVYSLPTIVQEESAASVATAVEGNEMELHCPVSHAETVKWYKDASLISTGVIKFPNVSRSDEAEYTCVATNVVGSALTRVALQVQWPPALRAPADEDLEVLQGMDHYFHCETDAKPRAKTKWLFNSKPIFGEDKDVLKLLNVQLRQSGVYECVARNEHGTVRKRFSFDVLEPPFISDFDLLDVQLKSGVNATLECVAKGSPKPTIEWSFNNTKWFIQNTTLTTNNVTQQSEGLFRCDARNKAGVTHIVYNVVVVSSATVDGVVMYVNGEATRVEDKVELSLGSKVRIACKAAGSPSPIVQWIRHGNTVSQNSEDINYADLMLERVGISDNGEYTCIASNEGGIQEKKIKVYVLEPPRIFQTLFQNANHSQNEIDLEVIVGQAFYMHCHPYGNPLPEIYWFKNGFPLRFYDDTMVSTDFGEIVISKSANEDQSGNYTCVAKNKVGEASVVYLVDVLVPPPIHKDNIRHASVLINNTLNLTCPAEGRPTPYVMWFKHPYTEIVESTRVKLLDDNYTLIITETKVSDSGKYSCTMTNKVGTTELIYDVVVLKPPTIIGNEGNNTLEEHVVDLRKSIVLKCEVDGNPMPNITWYKDVQRLSESEPHVQNVRGGSLLALWGARERDAGPYVCVAESGAGTAHRRHLLRVRVPGKWSAWSQWSYCNVTCGLGYQHRSRRCQYIDDDDNIIDKISQPDKIILDESSCKGNTEDNRKCHMPACEEEAPPARWSSWSRWSSCSASCGVGTQARTRRCRAELPCVGDNVQIRKCPGLPKCRVNREKNNNFQSNEDDVQYMNPDYLPEATFEMDSNPVGTQQPEGYDDYYTPLESPRQAYYDVNVTENLDQSEQGPCEPGHRYTAKNDSCEDIDECLLETNACHLTQVCSNTARGYRCSCPSGYYSLGVGQRCLDVNECALGRHACEFACVNAAGGYVCACPPHLRLHDDRHHCVSPSSSYRKPYVYEDENNADYLSTSFEYPARKRRH